MYSCSGTFTQVSPIHAAANSLPSRVVLGGETPIPTRLLARPGLRRSQPCLAAGEGVPFAPLEVIEEVSRPDGPANGFHRLPEDVPPLRLLVVDDDASLRKACCEIAAGMGFVPLAAGSVS